MLKRFLGFVVVGTLLLGFGWLFHLNPAQIELHVTPSKTYTLPLPLLVLGSFLAGASAIFLLALVREAQWTLSDRRRRRIEGQKAKGRALVAAGRDQLWHGHPERAKRMLRRASAGERDVESLAVLGETALAAGRSEEARIVLEDALAIHADHPRLLALRASVSARESEWREATALLERAVAGEPDSPRLCAALRDAYVRERRWGEAVRAEDRYVALLRTPREVEAERPRMLGLRYEHALELDPPEESVHALRDLLRRNPAFVPAAIALGDTLRHLDRSREAGSVWLRTARLRPEPVLLARIESLYRELGQPSKVLTLYRSFPGRPPVLVEGLIRFLLAEGAIEEAAAELDRAEASLPERSRALLRGEIERRRGKSELALDALRMAFESAPGDTLPHACGVCGRSFLGWIPRCSGCGAWDSVEAAGGASAESAITRRDPGLLRRLMGR